MLSQTVLPISFKQLPKTEQHVHIEATAYRDLLETMAQRNGLGEIFKEVEPVLHQFTAKNFLEFLTAYDLMSLFINTPQDVEELVLTYLRRCKSEGLTHVAMTCSYDHTKVERTLFVSPFKKPEEYTQVEQIADKVRTTLSTKSKHLNNLTYPEYIDAVASAIEKAGKEGISAEIIMVILRHDPIEKAEELLDCIKNYRHPYVTTIGLAGDEVNNPAHKFAQTMKRAREMGLHIAPHICELAPPKFLDDTLSTLGPLCRVGHAITAFQSPKTIERLVRLSNPAKFFLALLAQSPNPSIRAQQLLVQLDEEGVLNTDADEDALKKQLELICVDDTQRECLNYLFQPLVVELSPTSNLLLIDNINALSEHPIKEFINAGIRFSINSDDPVFWGDRVQGLTTQKGDFEPSPNGCSVGSEWNKVQRLYKLSDEQMLKIYRDSVISMTCPNIVKAKLLKHADLYQVYHRLKTSLTMDKTVKELLEKYEDNPSEFNATLVVQRVDELDKALNGFHGHLELARKFIQCHKSYSETVMWSEAAYAQMIMHFKLNQITLEKKEKNQTHTSVGLNI